MTPGERRGRRLFLVLATVTVLVKVGGAGLGVVSHRVRFDGFLALVLAMSVPFLWRGNSWLQRLVGVTFLLSGALSLFDCVLSLPGIDVLGASVAFSGILGLVDVLAGLAFLFLPDLGAFFRHQRETKLAGNPEEDLDFARRSFPVAAAGCGLALGCGSGLLLAAQFSRFMEAGLSYAEVLVGLLIGIGIGGLAGVVSGLAVGVAGPGEGLTRKRLAVTRGLIAAGACVITAIVLAAIYGGLFSKASAFYATSPGWQSAALAAVIWTVLGSPMVAPTGFVLGAAVALLVRDGDVGG
jgi:hypothetical protein